MNKEMKKAWHFINIGHFNYLDTATYKQKNTKLVELFNITPIQAGFLIKKAKTVGLMTIWTNWQDQPIWSDGHKHENYMGEA